MAGEIGDLRTRDVSELLVLIVIGALGVATLYELFESLKTATEDAKVPFSVGPSLENVLKWRESLNEVREDRAGGHKVYRLTDEGRRVLAQYNDFLLEQFPRLSDIRRNGVESAI